MQILVDVDDTLCSNHFLPSFNRYMGLNLTEADFSSYMVEDDYLKTEEEKERYWRFHLQTNSYADVKIFDHAKEVLKKLMENGHEVFFVTAYVNHKLTAEFSRQMVDKFLMLLKEFPFIPPQNFIFANRKDMIKGDLLMDDRLKKLTDSPAPIKILFTAHHNKQITGEELAAANVVRVNNWKEAEGYLQQKKILVN